MRLINYPYSVETLDREVYGDRRKPAKGKRGNKGQRPIPVELQKQILELFASMDKTNTTRTGIVRQINRRLDSRKEEIIKRVLLEAEEKGKIKLPPPTNRGGKRPRPKIRRPFRRL